MSYKQKDIVSLIFQVFRMFWIYAQRNMDCREFSIGVMVYPVLISSLAAPSQVATCDNSFR